MNPLIVLRTLNLWHYNTSPEEKFHVIYESRGDRFITDRYRNEKMPNMSRDLASLCNTIDAEHQARIVEDALEKYGAQAKSWYDTNVESNFLKVREHWRPLEERLAEKGIEHIDL
jgi:hypothetical protein